MDYMPSKNCLISFSYVPITPTNPRCKDCHETCQAMCDDYKEACAVFGDGPVSIAKLDELYNRGIDGDVGALCEATSILASMQRSRDAASDCAERRETFDNACGYPDHKVGGERQQASNVRRREEALIKVIGILAIILGALASGQFATARRC